MCNDFKCVSLAIKFEQVLHLTAQVVHAVVRLCYTDPSFSYAVNSLCCASAVLARNLCFHFLPCEGVHHLTLKLREGTAFRK